MTNKLVIWGAGSWASVVADMVGLVDGLELVGFLDDVHPDRHGSKYLDHRILGGRERKVTLCCPEPSRAEAR